MNPEILLSSFQRIIISDGLLRKNLESELQAQALADPILYLQSSLMILHSHQNVQSDSRFFGVIHLKSMILNENFQKSINLETFLHDLSFLLRSEPNTQILSFLSEIYGEIAGKFLKAIDLTNNDLLNNDVWDLLSMNEPQRIVAGLDILTKLVEVSLEELLTVFKDNLLSIIKKTLAYHEPQILKAASKLVSRILSYADYSLCKKYISLIPQILEIMFNFIAQGISEGENILSDLYEVAESEPKAFVSSFTILLSKTIELHALPNISKGLQQQTLELILSIIERIPKSLPLSSQALESLFQLIFLHTMSLNDLQNYESFSEETDSEFESVRFGREAIDRLISSLGGKPILETFSQYIQKLLQMSDWRCTFAALMGLSQVGEYLNDVDEIENSLELSMNYASHPHPMIRYAVCHTLGQLANDMMPEFQMKYHTNIMPMLINMLHDKSTFVASHSTAALNNFINGMNLKQLIDYLPTLIPELLTCIGKTEGQFKEQAILALSNASKISRDHYLPYMKVSIDTMILLIKQSSIEKFRRARGLALGTISQIGGAVGYENFKEYMEDLMAFLKIPAGEHFDIPELTVAWRRLLDFIDPEILMKFMSPQNWESILGMPDLSQDKPQEFEESLKLLNIFLEKMTPFMLPHFDRVSNLLIPLANSGNANGIRVRALKSFPFLVKMLTYDSKHMKQAELMITGLLDLFLKINEEKIDLEIRSQLIKTLTNVIQEAKGLQKPDFANLIKLIWDNIELSVGNKLRFEKKKTEDEELDEDQEELLNDDIKAEKEFLLLLGDLLGVVFKNFEQYLEEFKIIETFLMDLAPKALDFGLPQFALYILDDILDSVNKIEILTPHRETIGRILMNHALNKNCELRQASVYGLGVFVEKFKNLEITIVENIRLTLIDAIKIKQKKENNKIFGSCKDNAVSALGRLLKGYHQQINLKQTMQIWLEGFPIKYDIKEAFVQYDLLFGLLNVDPNSVIMDSSDNLEKIFKIIGEIYGTSLINSEITEMILKFVKNIMNLKYYDFDKFGLRFKEMNSAPLKRLEQCFKDVENS